MTTPYYNALIPLATDTDVTVSALASRLAARLSGYRVVHQDQRVAVAQNDWSLSVVLSSEDWVNIEANEIADTHPDWPNIEKLRQSSKRLELSSYCDDSAMDHFNTYLFVLDVIDKFDGVLFKFDPRDGGLI